MCFFFNAGWSICYFLTLARLLLVGINPRDRGRCSYSN